MPRASYLFWRGVPVVEAKRAFNTPVARVAMCTIAQDIEDAHRLACEQGLDRYDDPSTGYGVFTALSHERRGFCCGNACRHCPYGHLGVTKGTPSHNITQTMLVHLAEQAKGRNRRATKPRITTGMGWKTFEDCGPPREVLFWSGGKDSFLTLKAMQSEFNPHRITLLTTFDSFTGTVAFQNTKITDIMEQAKAESLDLLAVPLRGGEATTATGPYVAAVFDALRPLNVQGLAFGDLHLEDIRSWREETFSGAYPCRFPLFGVPYDDLLGRLFAMEGITVRVTSVMEGFKGVGGLEVGKMFDSALVDALTRAAEEGTGTVDRMGENGEFHSHVYHDQVDGVNRSFSGDEESTEEDESDNENS
ncbi:unnamed protein product [Discosporangium mesarthrocarpum]